MFIEFHVGTADSTLQLHRGALGRDRLKDAVEIEDVEMFGRASRFGRLPFDANERQLSGELSRFEAADVR